MNTVEDIRDVGVLADDVRRALYLYVSSQRASVGRDQAASALGIPRHQAKFQLDRLEEAGLLDTDYVRLSGRSGPGAGRPSKVYRRSRRELSISLPGREYALAGELMADAITRSTRDSVPVDQALADIAAARGREIGRGHGQSGTPLQIAMDALAHFGYEPVTDGEQVVLVNCPFHSLAQAHTELVCGMNEALLGGVCESVGGISAHLDPGDDRCCVVLRSRTSDARPSE